MPDVTILQCTQCTWHGPATSRIDTQAQGNEDWIYPACPKCGNDEFTMYNEKAKQMENLWIGVNNQMPEEGEEVLCFNEHWINEDFNPKGIRIGFLTSSGFTTAHWWDYQDTYMTISKEEVESEPQAFSDTIKAHTEPTHWMRIPGFNK